MAQTKLDRKLLEVERLRDELLVRARREPQLARSLRGRAGYLTQTIRVVRDLVGLPG